MKQLLLVLIILPICSLARQDRKTTKDSIIHKGVILKVEKSDTLKSGYQLIQEKGKNGQTLKLSLSTFNGLTQGANTIFPVVAETTPDSLERKNLGFQLSVDQDAFYGKANEDRDYTMGLMASIIGYQRRSRIAWFTPKLEEKERNASRFHLNFGFSGFTPENLGTSQVITDDRPYAAIAYFSYSELFRYNEHGEGKLKFHNTFSHTLLVGSMGSAISKTAKFIQTAIHSGQRSNAKDSSTVRPNPLGWGHAIGHQNKLSPVFSYEMSYSPINTELTIAEVPFGIKFIQPFKIAVNPNAGLTIGTLYDNLSLGGDWEIGLFNRQGQFGNTVTKDARGQIISIKKNRVLWGLSVIGDFYGQYWLHNSTINGILFSGQTEDHTISHSEMKKWTSYSSIGGQFTVGNFKLGYSVYHRSAVMKLNPRTQSFGRFFLKVDI